MKVIVVGLGIQGKKRAAVAASDCVATVDPLNKEAVYRDVKEVSLEDYEAALVCTPDDSKMEILKYLLNHKKHVLVEKPLISTSDDNLNQLQALAKAQKVSCYTAYNHRFEPHFIKMKELIDSKRLGTIYYCRMFYGNGTARDVRNSLWRDKKGGVLVDLGSHLLDTLLFWFGALPKDFRVIRAHNFENKCSDHVFIGTQTAPAIDLEMSLLSWRNHFSCDIIGEKGSAHIESLCKWGPSTFITRERKLPSGRPKEESVTLVQSDPTWEIEYQHFKKMCKKAESNIVNDFYINSILMSL